MLKMRNHEEDWALSSRDIRAGEISPYQDLNSSGRQEAADWKKNKKDELQEGVDEVNIQEENEKEGAAEDIDKKEK